MDGGVSDSIPIAYMQKRGYDKNIVILTRDATYRKGKNNLMPLIKYRYKQYPKFIQAMKDRHMRYNETLDQLRQYERQCVYHTTAASNHHFPLRKKSG